MTEPSGKRPGQDPAAGVDQPHHISAIAHLFFSDDEMGEPLAGAPSGRDVVVTCFNESRISAFACAGLMAGARQSESDKPARAIQLVEEGGPPWSAASFLGGEVAAAVTADHDASVAALRYTHWPALPDDESTGLEVFEGLPHEAAKGGAGAPAHPGCQGLVACLLESEMEQCGTAFRLGRLVGLLKPERLEIVIFADSWARNGEHPSLVPAQAVAASAGLLARCRGLTRAVAGFCAVTITPLVGANEGADVALGVILPKIAARLACDISVDPAS